MKFTPKTEDQIQKEQLPPEGWHEAEVVTCEEAVSAKGNPMLKMQIRLFTPDGDRVMFDYLLDAFAMKLIHFCRAAGLEDQYNSGELKASACVQCLVEAEVKHKTQKSGEYAGQVQAQISDYRAVNRTRPNGANTSPPPKGTPVGTKIEEADIPF